MIAKEAVNLLTSTAYEVFVDFARPELSRIHSSG